MISLHEIDFSNRDFWVSFMATSFPTALEEETDMSLTELMTENEVCNTSWWDSFTKYYDGLLEKSDGYVDNPETLICELAPTQTLKIEFHPGDTIYFINDKQILYRWALQYSSNSIQRVIELYRKQTNISFIVAFSGYRQSR